LADRENPYKIIVDGTGKADYIGINGADTTPTIGVTDGDDDEN
jgi:hypothetical protein